MHLQEIEESGYRVFVGALESPRGDGYTAALAVEAGDATRAGGRRGFRDELLACGHRWSTADDAMAYALRQARAWIRAERRRAGVGAETAVAR